MQQRTIDIGIPIDLAKLLDTRLLIQAGSGGGKSYALRKVIESVGNQAQQIILDPEGEFVTLREKYDFALVGKGGDIPLTLKYAETLAHKLLETGMSAIIDLYELKHHERILFVKRFLDAMINAPKELWHSCLIYVDEAHIFCPESSKAESMGSVIDLCTRGRKRGFAAILATQRLSKLHKDAAAECLNKLIGRTGLDIDRKRAGEELGFTAKQDLLNMRDLVPGEFHAFGPAISAEVVKFKVNKVVTTHPQAGRRITTVPPTPDAIKRIVSKLQDIPEEAERELSSKQQLQAEVTRLRTELTRLSRVPAKTAPVNIEKYTAEIQRMKEDSKSNGHALTMLTNKFRETVKAIKQIYSIAARYSDDQLIPEAKATTVIPEPRAVNQNTVKSIPESIDSAPKKPGRCGLAILKFLATYPKAFSKVQVAVATGYSVSSGGFNNSLSELNILGLIIRDAGRLEINPHGNYQEWTGPIGQKEYSATTFSNKLSKCEREIYEVLLASPQQSFMKENIANLTPTQYSHTSGGFNNSLSALSTLELIVREKGMIKLNPELLELI